MTCPCYKHVSGSGIQDSYLHWLWIYFGPGKFGIFLPNHIKFGYFPIWLLPILPDAFFFIAILNLVFLLLISMPHQERQQPYTIGGIEMERFGTCCCILLRREVQEECWLSRAAFQQFHLAKCRTQTFALAFGTSSSRECPCSTGDAPCCFEFLGTGHAAQGGLWRQQKHLAWKDGAVKGNMIVFLGTTIAPK